MRFFDDLIFRKEDVLDEFEFVPNDEVEIKFSCKEHIRVYVVREDLEV